MGAPLTTARTRSSALTVADMNVAERATAAPRAKAESRFMGSVLSMGFFGGPGVDRQGVDIAFHEVGEGIIDQAVAFQ